MMQFNTRIFEFTKENISMFKTPNFARTKNDSHIRKLQTQLKNFNYQLGSAITVIKLDSGNYLVIDGNHRIEAFKNILNSGETDKIISVLIEYPTMIQDKEKDLMRILGICVKKQNIESLFEVFQEDILVFQKQKEYPMKVSIKQRKGFFKLIHLINILEAKDDYNMSEYSKSIESTLNIARNTQNLDVYFLKEYLTYFEEIFGRITQDNRYAVPCFMVALASIYGINHEKIQKDISNAKKRFQNLMQDPELLDWIALNSKSRQNVIAIRRRQINVLNKRLLRNQELFE